MTARSPVARLAADRRRRHAETIAAWWLRQHGYRIVARRVRTRVGEIDLVVRRGKLLAFIEVKARNRLDNALAALHSGVVLRIAAAANALTEHCGGGCTSFRIDAVIIVRGQWPRHYRDVWRGE